MKVLAMLVLCLNAYAGAGDFVFLKKDDAKAFETAHRSIEEAFRDQNLSPIASFGPSILARYSALLLQSDPWAKKLRPAYRRLDSLVAYAIVRGHVDSLMTTLKSPRPPETELATLRQMDRLLAFLAPTTVLCTLDGPYCDSQAAAAKSYLTERIPAFVEAMKAQGKLDLAYQGLQGLSFQSPALQHSAQDLEKRVEKEFRQAMSSYDREVLLNFRSKYPAYKTNRIDERLGSLEADEMFHLLAGHDKAAMVTYLQANPSSPFAPDVRKRLEPLLLTAALELFDPEACRAYLSLFPASSENARKVAETLSWMMRPAMDSGATPASTGSPYEGAPSPAIAVPTEDDGEDGPRSAPLPEGYSPLLGSELGRLGIQTQGTP